MEEKPKQKKKKRLKEAGGGAEGKATTTLKRKTADLDGKDKKLKKKLKKKRALPLPGGGAGSASSSSSAAGAKKKRRWAGAAGHEDDEDTWEGCWSGDRRLAAVMSGVKWVLAQQQQQQQQQQQPTTEDDDAIPALYALVRLTLDPVRQDVLEALAPHLEAWKHRCLADAGVTMPGTDEGWGRWSQAALIGELRRVVRLERLGVYAQEEAKRQLAGAYVSVRKRASMGGGKQAGTAAKMAEACVWDVQDLLGWNPMAGPPPEGLPDPTAPHRRLSRLELMARSLEWASLVEQSGLVHGGARDAPDPEEEEEEEEEEDGEGEGAMTGHNRVLSSECRLAHVLKWLPALRPYLGPAQCRSPQEYAEQASVAVSAVMALSRNGELRIPALLLPHEYFFLREHLPVHLAQRNVALVARSLDALRVLGGHDENPIFRAGMVFLLHAQRGDGRWPTDPTAHTEAAQDAAAVAASSSSSISSYTPTLAAVRALLVREFRGFGPFPLDSVDLLLKWQRQDADPPSSASSGSASSTNKPANQPLLIMPDGAPDPRLEGMAARVQAVRTAAKRRAAAAAAAAAAAPAPAPAPAPPPPAAAAAAALSEMERRVVAVRDALEAARDAGKWGEVLAGLQALEREPMTVGALTTTMVGRVVSSLRKVDEQHEGVAALAKQLVKEWKKLVNPE